MSNTEVKANPKYKDHLFMKIFGGENEESKRNLLSLYNALNDSHYENIDELEITTMEEALYIKVNNINIYGKKLAKIPNPKYIVFYNGSSERPSIEDLKLSSAFMNKDSSGNFEWTATVYNLNKGKSEVMDVVITEYDEKALMEGFHAEGKEEDLAEGIAKGRLEQLVDLVKDGLIKVADAARKSGMSEEEFKLLLK